MCVDVHMSDVVDSEFVCVCVCVSVCSQHTYKCIYMYICGICDICTMYMYMYSIY